MLLYYCYYEMEMMLCSRFFPATILMVIDNLLHDNKLILRKHFLRLILN